MGAHKPSHHSPPIASMQHSLMAMLRMVSVLAWPVGARYPWVECGAYYPTWYSSVPTSDSITYAVTSLLVWKRPLPDEIGLPLNPPFLGGCSVSFASEAFSNTNALVERPDLPFSPPMLSRYLPHANFTPSVSVTMSLNTDPLRTPLVQSLQVGKNFVHVVFL